MATVINPNIYSGGAVKLNSQPELNLYAQLQARRQAKQDALDQYYQKALTEVTPTGMRAKDITEGWGKKLQDWQNFGVQNKKYLLNPQLDNYKTLTQFNNMHADLLADAQKSKEANAQEKDIYGLIKGGKWTPTGDIDQKTGKFTSGSDMDIKDRLSKSIYDPTRLDETGNEPDVTQFSINAPQLTGQQLLQFNKAAEMGQKRGKQKTLKEPVQNPITGRVEQEYQDVFTPDQAKQNADRYGNIVAGNKSLINHYNSMLHSEDLEQLERLNNVYKQAYPNGTMDSPVELAKAEKLMLDSTPSNIRMEAVPNTELAYQRSLNKIGYNAQMQGKFGTGGNPPPPKDASGENYDLTERLQGIKVMGLPTGQTLGVKPDTKILYNPSTDRITYTDIKGNKKEKTFDEFKKDISTINTAQDLKIVDEVMQSIKSPETKKKNESSQVKKVTVKGL